MCSIDHYASSFSLAPRGHSDNCSWMTDGIITINWEDYAQMKKMRCKNVYHINGVGVDTSRYHECQIDRETYRKSLGLSENDIAILEVDCYNAIRHP